MNQSTHPKMSSLIILWFANYGMKLAFIGAVFSLQSACLQEGALDGTHDLVSSYSLSNNRVDFGEQPLNEEYTQRVTVTNTGETGLVLLEDNASAELSVELYPPVVYPGESSEIEVTWFPTSPNPLNETISFFIGETEAVSEPVTIDVNGKGLGAAATLSFTAHDFGEVSLGCERSITITLSNTGNEPLQVDSLDLQADADFRMKNGQLPWTIPPFHSKQFDVVFAPTTIVMNAAVIQVGVDSETMQIPLAGMGIADEEETLSFIAGRLSKSVILFHVNACAISNTGWTWADRFNTALPYFFQTLIDQGARFRVGFIWNANGGIEGDFIDNSYSAREASSAAKTMLQNGTGTDNDRSLDTLIAGLDVNQDWINEKGWEDAQISLIAINRDTEQSITPASSALTAARMYREDDSQVVFHAIGGPPGTGCTDPKGGIAESFDLVKSVVDATGGVFSSICEPSWVDPMQRLANGSVSGFGVIGAHTVSLTGTPLISSISVQIDGQKLPSGWTYDSGLNAVVFDGEYALYGEKIEIHYRRANECG